MLAARPAVRCARSACFEGVPEDDERRRPAIAEGPRRAGQRLRGAGARVRESVRARPRLPGGPPARAVQPSLLRLRENLFTLRPV